MRAVEVTRHWPRTVEIRVHERVAAAVQARGPAYMLVDRTGVAFAPVDRRPAGLPLVSAPVDAGAPALRAALDVLEELPAAVRDQVRQVRAASREDVQILLSHHRTVLWGSVDRGARKAAVLAVLVTRKAADLRRERPRRPHHPQVAAASTRSTRRTLARVHARRSQPCAWSTGPRGGAGRYGVSGLGR